MRKKAKKTQKKAKKRPKNSEKNGQFLQKIVIFEENFIEAGWKSMNFSNFFKKSLSKKVENFKKIAKK